jgi:hypothetical protein
MSSQPQKQRGFSVTSIFAVAASGAALLLAIGHFQSTDVSPAEIVNQIEVTTGPTAR